MIRIEDLTYCIGGKCILRNITTSFEQGKIHGIIGPNGAGKSTLLKHMMGLAKVENNKIFLQGMDICQFSVKEYAKKCSFVFQENTRDYDFTVEEILFMGRYPYMNFLGNKTKNDEQIVRQVVEDLNLNRFLNRSIKELSGGEAQKVFIGRALVQQTPLLLLDEPTSMLDIHNSVELLKLLKTIRDKYDITVIMVMHDLNLAFQFCDQVMLLRAGEVIIDCSSEKVIESDALQEVYGHKLQILKSEDRTYIVPKIV